MPTVRRRTRVPFARPDVFAFFLRPAHAVALAPPGAGLSLVEAPEVLTAGARVVVQVRRWGLSRRIVTEVTELVGPERVVEQQREGPLGAWRHVRTFEASGEGTGVVEEVTFEPPGGLLGLTLTAARVARDLEDAFAWRDGRLDEAIRAWLSARPTAGRAAPP